MKRLYTLILLFISAGPALANPCPGALDDYFAPGGKVFSGKYTGECLETHKRSYRIVRAEDASHGIPKDVVLENTTKSQFIANISHDGDYWISALPKSGGIESITLMIEHFQPRWLVAHSMLRVDFVQPITLYSQTNPRKAPVELKTLILSIEALGFQGGPKFGLISTLGEAFTLATRLQSLDDRVALGITEEKNLIRQYRLDLPIAQKDSFWFSLLEKLHDPEMRDRYNLLNRNCMNVLFEGIDAVLGRARGIVQRFRSFYPVVGRSSLASRDILDRTKIISLNEELEIAAAHTKRVVCTMGLLPLAQTSIDAEQLGP